jgi:hypothetical protein
LWDEVIYLSEGRASIAAITYGDKVYFAGGALPDNSSSDVVDIYNVEEGTWEDPEILSSPRIVTALNIYNALVFTGHVEYIDLTGFVWPNATGVVDIYFPEAGNWGPSVPDLDPARVFYAHVAYNNRAYYAGGSQTNLLSILDLETGFSDNIVHEKELHVYPNPFTTSIQINYNLQRSSNVEFAIYNSIGEQVEVLNKNYQQQGDQQITFNTEDLKPGVYFCALKTSNGIQTTKIIKL